MKLRKYLLLIVPLILLLSGCGKGDTSTVTKEKETSSNNVEEKEEKNELDIDKKLGFTTQDILNLELFKDESDKKLRSYQLENGLKVDTMNDEHGTFRFFAYYKDDSEYPSALLLKNNGNNKDLSVNTLDTLYVEFSDELKDVTEVVKDENDEYYMTGFIFNEELEYDTLPKSLSEITDDDFFLKDGNVEFYNKAINNGDYKALYDKILTYINGNEVDEFDSAHEILEIIEPVESVLENVEINYDDIENLATIYYKGLNDVSSQNYIVPYITTKDKDMNILLGFEKDGWLFFDEIIFNIDGEVEKLYSLDPETSTLGGSKIRETIIKDYDEELIDKLINAKEVKMRFSGKNGELDYTLTDVDIKALKVIRMFNDLYPTLPNLEYRFNR